MIRNKYLLYHLHTELSMLDSCTNYKLYIDKVKELGMTALCFSEHGNIYNWLEKKKYCEKQGLKYIHGCEVYLTEKLYDTIQEEDKDGNMIDKQVKIRDNSMFQKVLHMAF
jgi:DNA polymerase-3 subunit alpha